MVEGQSRRKKKEAGKKSATNSGAATPVVEQPKVVQSPALVAAALEAEAALTSDDKKRRALMKKLTAIDQLKAKKAAGEKLELTQHKKLDRCVRPLFLLEVEPFADAGFVDSEAEIRKELKALEK